MGKVTGHEYVQYLTERVVHYLDMPVDQRKAIKQTAKATREPWLLRWFGVGGAYVYLQQQKKKHQDE